MNRILFFSLLLLLSLLLFSTCQNPEGEIKSEHSAKEEEKDKIPNPYNIELNEGKKWKVVPEMMAIIRSMETQVNQFTGKEMEQHIINAKVLQQKVDSLTSNCTMTGKAHDELHKWLLPYLDMVDTYNQTNTARAADSIFLEIKQSFVYMNYYFE